MIINNIKEFFDIKDNACFVCKHQLSIFFNVFGARNIEFELKENILYIRSRFVSFNIDIYENKIEVPDKIGNELYIFLSMQYLHIVKQCTSCDEQNLSPEHFYVMQGDFSFESSNMTVKPVEKLIEITNIDNFALATSYSANVSKVRFNNMSKRVYDLPFTSMNKTQSDWIDLPFVDIGNITIEQLEKKINNLKAFL